MRIAIGLLLVALLADSAMAASKSGLLGDLDSLLGSKETSKVAAKPAEVAKPAAAAPAAKVEAAKPVAPAATKPKAPAAVAKPAEPAAAAAKPAEPAVAAKPEAPAAAAKPETQAAAAEPEGAAAAKPATAPEPEEPAAVPPASAGGIPIFNMNCDVYPEVCNNFCVLQTCAGFNTATGFLHRDANANQKEPGTTPAVSANQARRNAIGCGRRTNCNGVAELTCDEQPPASTYEGGLGCIAERFVPTGVPLFNAGVTRCVPKKQNEDHGDALNKFFRSEGLADQHPFRIGFPSIANAALCKALNTEGKSKCPPAKGLLPTGKTKGVAPFGLTLEVFTEQSQLIKTEPASNLQSPCPSRPKTKRRAGFHDMRRLIEQNALPRNASIYVSDTEGSVIHLPHGAAPKLGERIFHVDARGNPKITFVSRIL